MGIVDLTQNLENFKWTKYAATTENNSQIGGRHGGIKPNGQPPHPKDHSELDDGAGVPQTFYDGHSSIVTGQQTFERPNPKSLEEMVSNFGPLETEPETRGPYGVTDYMDEQNKDKDLFHLEDIHMGLQLIWVNLNILLVKVVIL